MCQLSLGKRMKILQASGNYKDRYGNIRMERSEIEQQKREIDRYADELREVRTKLVIHKQILENAWVSGEEEGVSDAIDRLNRQIRDVTDEMNRLGKDFIRAYEELLEEEKRMQEQQEQL